MSRPEKIIGLAGASCSGKTTLERNLITLLEDELAIFPFDDMFIGRPALQGVKVDNWESPTLYRWDDFLHGVSELKLGNAVTIKANSRESKDAGIDTRVIEPRSFVIVIGFLALHDERIRAFYDEMIFIELPEEEIIRRRKARANPDSPWDSDEYINNSLIPGHHRYVEPQKEFADYVVDGTLPPDVLAGEVARLITQKP